MNISENNLDKDNLLINSLINERNYFLFMSLTLFGLALLLVFLMGGVAREIAIVMSIVSLFVLVLGFKLLYEGLRNYDVFQSELVKTIESEPLRIVWVYSTLTLSSPYGINLFNSGIIYFKLIDGSQIELRVPHKRLKKVTEELQMLLPHSSFGHSTQKEQWYIAEPAMLLKSAEEMNGDAEQLE